MKLERMRQKSNEGEETYQEAGEEVDKDCKRNSEEENEKEMKINFINIFQNQSRRGVTAGEILKPRREKEQPKKRRRRSCGKKLKKKEEETHERAFSPLLFSRISTLVGLTLIHWAYNCLSWTAH